MEKGVKRGDGREIVEIDCKKEDLKGTLPVGDMHMPYLRILILSGNMELTGDIGTLVLPAGMQNLNLQLCSGLNGKATAEDYVTIEGHTLQSATHRPSFLTVSLFLAFTSPFAAGDIGKLVIPEGMQSLVLSGCDGLAGKANGYVTSEGHTLPESSVN
jgi:hypothetical protein